MPKRRSSRNGERAASLSSKVATARATPSSPETRPAVAGRRGPARPRAVSEIRRALLRYYDEHRRQLPWRRESDPYRILVSEVMLQQTRVETVLGYYGAWLDRFPDLQSLADAGLDEVLEAWEGLGYYRRAHNLHRIARLVRERAGGELPHTYEELRTLPGVGEYTAGAVASIAFGEAVPAPDGNVRRVLARLFDVPDPRPAWVRDTAADLVDPDRPGDWNQALMELGATVCTSGRPACGRCPLRGWCVALAAGTTASRPAVRPRKAPRAALLATAVLVHGGRVLLERRPEDGLLAGMWAFPDTEIAEERAAPGAVESLARKRAAGLAGAPRALVPYGHRFTHIAATYLPYLVPVSGARAGKDRRWLDPLGPVDLALPVAQRRILDSVRSALGEGDA